MISIIVCSRNRSLPEAFVHNINDTLGTDYELVIIDNHANSRSIFEAYKEGVARSTGDILCFVHDDVLFRSSNWGSCLESIFRDDTIGLVGVAGTYFLPCTPSSWWDPDTRSDNFIQGVKKGNSYDTIYVNHRNPHEEENSVVAIDGVFMAMPARLFDIVNWDTKTFTGFHCYDTDMSLQVLSAGYIIMIAREILIEHYSQGNCSLAFRESQQLLFEKWKSIFPVFRGVEMTEGEIEARTSLVKYKHESKDLSGTLEYRLGNIILHPFSYLKRHLKWCTYRSRITHIPHR